MCGFFFFQAEGGIRVAQESRGLGDVYKRQALVAAEKVHGKLIERHVCGCRFVRLIGEHGFSQ